MAVRSICLLPHLRRGRGSRREEFLRPLNKQTNKKLNSTLPVCQCARSIPCRAVADSDVPCAPVWRWWWSHSLVVHPHLCCKETEDDTAKKQEREQGVSNTFSLQYLLQCTLQKHEHKVQKQWIWEWCTTYWTFFRNDVNEAQLLDHTDNDQTI